VLRRPAPICPLRANGYPACAASELRDGDEVGAGRDGQARREREYPGGVGRYCRHRLR